MSSDTQPLYLASAFISVLKKFFEPTNPLSDVISAYLLNEKIKYFKRKLVEMGTLL